VPDCAFTLAVNVTLCPLVTCIAELETVVTVPILAGATTVTDTALEVDPEKLASPEYITVIVCIPIESVLLLTDPDPPLSVAIPSDAAPSKNVIVPVGVPEPAVGVTTALNTTLCPLVTCIAEAESAVVVLVFAATTIVTGATPDVDSLKFVFPAYTAVTECVPTARLDELNVAIPDPFSTPLPICVVPSKKFTLPVGTPDPETGATVAVNVTLCPKVTCAAEALKLVVVAAAAVLFGVNTKTVTA
jgi:hypothetical protein